MRTIVTGGAGFIGSALVRHLIFETEGTVLNLDALTYAGCLDALSSIASHSRYHFQKVDIGHRERVRACFSSFQPDTVAHLAAESHVDRSIDAPSKFIETNIVGTCVMLEEARRYWVGLPPEKRDTFRFLHISTDEVYGDLAHSERPSREQDPYRPSSPYAASKASSDHLVRAWRRTYGLPTLVTNCSNNYGPYQYPEKLIPLVILEALKGNSLPVYGDGCQVRDWLYVDDHVRALHLVMTTGIVGETYHVGGHDTKRNIDVVETICHLLDRLSPRPDGKSYTNQILFVPDRPGHDTRYAIDADKIRSALGWAPLESFSSGLEKTVSWYLASSKKIERGHAANLWSFSPFSPGAKEGKARGRS